MKKPVRVYDVDSIYPNAKMLSSSQFLLYIKSPSDFYMEWVLGVRRESSLAMTLGRLFSSCYEDRERDISEFEESKYFDLLTIQNFRDALKRLPVIKNGQPEYPMIGEKDGWKFRATLDDFVESSSVIVENKTGKVKWTQERADNDMQMTFQAWCFWKRYGFPPKSIILNWWDTSNKNYAKVLTFKTKRLKSQLESFDEIVGQVIKHLEAGNFSKNIFSYE